MAAGGTDRVIEHSKDSLEEAQVQARDQVNAGLTEFQCTPYPDSSDSSRKLLNGSLRRRSQNAYRPHLPPTAPMESRS